MFEIKADVICDSVNQFGDRLTTFVLTYHRFIHSEMLTHRMFSRGSSSSRAIPVEKMIKLVESQAVYPIHWGANQKGMSASKEVDDEQIAQAIAVWREARLDAIKHAKALVAIGIHKQVVNRLLEPFSTITVVCSGTEYKNFFELRCHPDAQPEIQDLANKMRLAYDESQPKLITSDDPIPYHLPFLHEDDLEFWSVGELTTNDLVKLCIGRCARVSYLNHDGIHSPADDLKLYDRLLTSKPAHLSPFEHVAQPKRGEFANFTGFQSYRNQLEQSKNGL